MALRPSVNLSLLMAFSFLLSGFLALNLLVSLLAHFLLLKHLQLLVFTSPSFLGSLALCCYLSLLFITSKARKHHLDLFITLTCLRIYARPLFLSFIQLLDKLCCACYGDDLDDFSYEAAVSESLVPSSYLSFFNRWIPAPEPSHPTAPKHSVFSWWLQVLDVSVRKFGAVINPLPSADFFMVYLHHHCTALPGGLFTQLLMAHKFVRPKDVPDYVRRVEALPAALETALIGMDSAKKLGRLPPVCSLEKIRDQLITGVSEEDGFGMQAALLKGMETCKTPLAERDGYTKRVKAGMAKAKEVVLKIADKITQEFIPATLPGDGVWRLTDCPAGLYEHFLTFHTGLEHTSAEEIHELGLREQARLSEKLTNELIADGFITKEQASQPGFSPAQTLKAIFAAPEYHYKPEEQTQALADCNEAIQEVNTVLKTVFDEVPNSKLKVSLHNSKGGPLAYAVPGSMDGSIPGMFYVTSEVHKIAKPIVKSIVWHEGIPGHVLERGISAQNKKLSFLGRYIPAGFSCYMEGWALYVETVLCSELGLYKTPMDRLGVIQNELMRSARLIVDTGIHSSNLRWDRSKALKFFMEATGMAEPEAADEIDRYIVMPGQACSYQVGCLKILELRQKAKQALGAKFDLKLFHRAILSAGPQPLFLLEKEITHWIESQQ